MMQFLKITSLGLVMVFLTACSISELGAPPLNPEDRWIRKGFTKSQIRVALNLCGENELFSIQQVERVDWCMLKQGFVFIDSPYKNAHKQCGTYSLYLNTPACRFLRGELSIPPIEAQSQQPRFLQESQPANTEPVTIAPTVTPSDQVLRENLKGLQRAQEKTQIKPYSPLPNLPAVPQAPNSRLEKLLN
jgi:hypothetical protein